jgi:hypothetical protein
MSANGPPRMKFESIVVHDAKRRLRLVMELLEQEWRRQQTHGASKPHANEEFHQIFPFAETPRFSHGEERKVAL